MELKNKSVAILAEEMFNELELYYPYYRLKEAGAQALLVGSGSSPVYRGKSGLTVRVDVSAERLSAHGLDAVIVPGGYAPDNMRRYPAMVELVAQTFAQGKLVAAICHAGWMLASAGVCRGKRVTSCPSIKDDLVNAGAVWLDQEVVVDGRLITSRQPDDLPAFMREIIKALA